MRIHKAVITAAAPDQRSLPLQSLVDRDGEDRSALAIVLEEVRSAGIEQACVVVHPGDEERYAASLADTGLELSFTVQGTPRGYGHALLCAREFVGDDPFLHLVSDHLYIGKGDRTCAQELVAIANKESAAVSAVQPTRENMLPYYGVVGGQRVPGRKDLYVVQRVHEKPTPTQAEQTLMVPGLRAGHYLCLFGMHALTPAIMGLLARELEAAGPDQSIDLASALTKLADKERYLAFEVPGRRHNIGVKYGLLSAQLALALAGKDREEVLAQLVELLAARDIHANDA